MRHAPWVTCLFVALAGCALPPERQAVRPLPADAPPQSYPDLVRRAREQVSFATEALCVDRWDDVSSSAEGLQNTAKFLTKATDVPPTHRDRLAVYASDLAKEADGLQDAAKKKNVKLTNDVLQRLNLKVREFGGLKN
jgi:hypothetical protein